MSKIEIVLETDSEQLSLSRLEYNSKSLREIHLGKNSKMLICTTLYILTDKCKCSDLILNFIHCLLQYIQNAACNCAFITGEVKVFYHYCLRVALR